MRQRPRPVVVRTGTVKEVVDYAQSEPVPSVSSRSEPAPQPAKSQEPAIDYLDIPAFLGRQAD